MKIAYAMIAMMLTVGYVEDFKVESIQSRYTAITAVFGTCSEVLQRVHGKKDKRSRKYSISLERNDFELNLFCGEKVPIFHLQVSGLPRNKKFQIVHRNALGIKTTVFDGVYLGGGKLQSETTFAPLRIGDFAVGEPSEFLLVDPEEKTTNAVFYLPFPAEPVVADGVKVSKFLVNINPVTYLFGIENLIPGEGIEMKAFSGQEVLICKGNAPASGNVTAAVIPQTEQKSGEALLEIRRNAGTIRIKYLWEAGPYLPGLPTPVLILTVDHSPTFEEQKQAIRIICSDAVYENIERLGKTCKK